MGRSLELDSVGEGLVEGGADIVVGEAESLAVGVENEKVPGLVAGLELARELAFWLELAWQLQLLQGSSSFVLQKLNQELQVIPVLGLQLE